MSPGEFAGAPGYRPAADRGELDRWILGELQRAITAITERMDAYDNYAACAALSEFVDALSNWYVRRSRDRFWAADRQSPEKLDAYWTLYECLATTAKLIAPFTPFVAEALWRNLAGVFGGRARESVHLCDFPAVNADLLDTTLSDRMRLLRSIASLGRAARMDNKLKVRQPLAQVEVILSSPLHQAWLEQHDALLREELNVKRVAYAREADQYITYLIQPNFKRLGPRIGKLLPAAKAALGQADGGSLLRQLTESGKVALAVGGETIELDSEDIQVRLQAKPGWAAAQGAGCVVVLATELTPELVREGLARDLIRLIQDRRKDLGLEYTDRIVVTMHTAAAEAAEAVRENESLIAAETLSDRIIVTHGPLPPAAPPAELGDYQIVLEVAKAGWPGNWDWAIRIGQLGGGNGESGRGSGQ